MLPLIPLAISLAPEIAKWLFGPSAEKTAAVVARVVSDVTGNDVSTVDGLAAAQSALGDKPELATQLRVQLAQIAADSERAERAADQAALAARFADVASARTQTVSLAQAKSAVQWAPVLISTVVLLTFGTVMWLALTHALPVGSETILNMLLGTLAAMATSVVAYWVGSSAGSATKTDMLYRSNPPNQGL